MKKLTYKNSGIFIIFNIILIIFFFCIYYLCSKQRVQNVIPLIILCISVILTVLILQLIMVNKLTQSLETALKDERNAKKNELRSHLFALQSQMNLHFWHNILGMISLDAQMRNDKKTTNMCNRLSKMLYFSSSKGDGFCTLGEELQHVVHYLSLMKERYDDLFEYTIEVPDAMKNIRIPKFIIQPICENAFNHAFKDKLPIWIINIKCHIEDDNWFIHISDNGNGFNEKLLMKFNTMKSDIRVDNTMEQMEKLSIGGLSLPNVYMRLLLSYNEKMIFNLNNTDTGASVILGGKIQ